MAISHANTVLDWQENLSKDEMPEECIWPFVEELNEHFEWVRAERDRKYGPKND